MAVVFIDTSVLCCLLNVPGKNQKREDVFAEYSRRRSAGDVFVLPISAVIETGNHIEQLGPGLNDARHHCADALCQMLRNVVDGAEQFVMHPLSWDEDLLREFCDGGASTPGFPQVATAGELGGGDLSILLERGRYRERVAVGPVEVWTLDKQLSGYASAYA